MSALFRTNYRDLQTSSFWSGHGLTWATMQFEYWHTQNGSLKTPRLERIHVLTSSRLLNWQIRQVLEKRIPPPGKKTWDFKMYLSKPCGCPPSHHNQCWMWRAWAKNFLTRYVNVQHWHRGERGTQMTTTHISNFQVFFPGGWGSSLREEFRTRSEGWATAYAHESNLVRHKPHNRVCLCLRLSVNMGTYVRIPAQRNTLCSHRRLQNV